MSSAAREIKQHLGRARVSVRSRDLLKTLASLLKALDIYCRSRLVGQEKYEVEGLMNEVLHAFGGLPAVKKLFPKGLLFKAGEVPGLRDKLKRLEAGIREAIEKAEYDKVLARKQDIDHQLLAAKKLLNDGSNLEARRILRSLLHKCPDEPGLASFIGRILFESGDFADAADYFKQACLQDVRSPTPFVHLVTIHENLGNLTEAEDAVKEVMKRFGASDAEYAKLAVILLKQNRIAEAKDAVATALKKNPENKKAKAILSQLEKTPPDTAA